MNYGEGGLSASDVALLSGNTGRNNDGFGDNSGWWIIVFLIFALGGFGRNGFGSGFGGGSGVADNYVLATDFATIERKLDAVNNGICDATFALNNTINNGFFGVQNSLTQGFGGLNTALLQGNYALSSQLSDCCCTIERGLDRVNYNNVINTNAIQQTLCNSTRDIIESQNANYRAIHEELVANKLEAKNDRIAEQQNEINALRLKASQEAQNNYLIDQLKPCPSPSYIVPNPNCCYNYGINGYGYNNNCGCNCGNY